ncbi:transketolase [Acidobacteriia bacterium AH_259_A11_L15]|nr:transketolase [Acidobacteriia bacterium AH_259_A11_L15]
MASRQTLGLVRDKATRLRIHSLKATTAAGSGHPTSCLSAADLVSALFFHVMRYDPRNPLHPAADRFVLSKGHAAPILYAAWAEAGYLPTDKLMELRQFGSELEGHPTPRFAASPVATGALGQGLSVGAGMAFAGKRGKAGYRVYVLLGDGESAEGSVWEAAAFAGHYQLDNLCAIVDVNRLGQSQPTMLQHDTQTYAKRFAAFGWKTFRIDGHNLNQILKAFAQAARVKRQPVAIIARTFKGKGVSFLENKNGWHGKAVPKDDLEKALKGLQPSSAPVQAKIKPPPPPRPVPASKPLAAPGYKLGDKVATRQAYGNALKRLAEADPRIIALDGDVKNSTFAEVLNQAHPDRFIECYIAEQNMVGVAVGLQTCGLIPFVSTFACFLTRAYDFIRMAAVSRAHLKLMGSHAGVSIGEDGASQMGLEDLAMMRAVAGSTVFYPSDAVAMERLVEQAAKLEGIVYLRGTRMKTPVLYDNNEEFVAGGSKVVRQSGDDAVTVVAAGVTLHEALKACEELKKEGIRLRVIDLYSVKPVDRETLLSAARATGNTLLVAEDHFREGGLGEAVKSALADENIRVVHLAVGTLPTSGKPEELLEAVGLSARHIAQQARALAKQTTPAD